VEALTCVNDAPSPQIHQPRKYPAENASTAARCQPAQRRSKPARVSSKARAASQTNRYDRSDNQQIVRIKGHAGLNLRHSVKLPVADEPSSSPNSGEARYFLHRVLQRSHAPGKLHALTDNLT